VSSSFYRSRVRVGEIVVMSGGQAPEPIPAGLLDVDPSGCAPPYWVAGRFAHASDALSSN
jgi:hypothetical protein